LLARTLRDPVRRRQQGERAKNHALSKFFSASAVAAEHEAAFRSVG
jgi:hypothetical protein